METIKQVYEGYVEKKKAGIINDPYEPQILSMEEYTNKYIHGLMR